MHAVASGHKVLYVALLLVRFLGLWLLEPLLFLGAIPDLAINLLSSKSDQTSIGYHWTAGIVPYVVMASVFGAARLKRGGHDLSLAVLVGAGCLLLFSPVYLATHDLSTLRSPLHAAKAHALRLIPTNVPVTTSNQLGVYGLRQPLRVCVPTPR